MKRTVKLTTAAVIQVYRNLKAALCVGLSFLIALAPTASYALDVQVNKTVNLRANSGSSSVLQKVGRLAAGSVVSIPDQYAIRKNGNVDFELTLNNWLSKSSSLSNDAGMRNFSETKKDFYFPIKVVKAAPGSQLGNQDSYMVALHFLQRKGALLETTESTDLMNVVALKQAPSAGVGVSEVAGETDDAASAVTSVPAPAAPVAATSQSFSNLEASALPACNDCGARDSSLHPLALGLQLALDAHLRAPLESKNRTSRYVPGAIAQFERTCGMRMENFVSSLQNEIARSTLRSTLPTKLNSAMMLSLMTQESTGDCNALGDKHSSAGLFQVNIRSSGYSRDQLRNPVTNARAALKNLELKQRALARDFDFSKMTEDDRLRVLLSAYNGGEKWVKRAKDDLLHFNRQQGAALNPNSWEDLRIFYFRRHLNSSSERQTFGTIRGREQRSTKNSLGNIAYTENIIPRAASSQGVSLQEAWQRRTSG